MQNTKTLARRSASGYIPTLDGWRAIAVFGVILFHSSSIELGTHSLRGVQDAGQFGVQLFFAISGFLICGRLLDEEKRAGSFSLRGFYIRRLFRIQPAAITFLLICAILAWLRIVPLVFGAWLSSLFGVRNLYSIFEGQSPSTLYTNHFWSLAVEEQFYLLFPLLLFAFRRNRLWLLGSLSFAAIAWASVAHRFLNIGGDSSGRTDLQLGGLLFAAVLAVAVRKTSHLQSYARLLPGLAVASLLAFVFSLGFMHNHYSALIVDVGFPLLILTTVLHPRFLLSRVLESRPFTYLGRISYSVYLWQQLFFVNAADFPPARGVLGVVQRWPVNLIAIAVLANVSYFLIERPLVRLGHRFTSSSNPQEGPGRSAPDRDLATQEADRQLTTSNESI